MTKSKILLKEILDEFSQILNRITEQIKNANNIAVIGHVNPDGDCVGSQLGLVLALNKIGKNAIPINEGKFKGIYKEYYEKHFEKDITNEYDLYIILDVPNKDRAGGFSNKIDFQKTIVIDHHITNDNFGKINWVSDKFIATAEMVFILLISMDFDFKECEVSQYLLNALLSDNGFFQHIRNDKYLSLLVSYLMIENGADSKISYDLMFSNNSIETEKLFALALQRLSSIYDGNVMWTYLTEEDKKKFNYPNFESGLVFREMMSIRGVKVSVFFKIDEEQNKIDISFRSTDDVDVSQVAASFGGGGHKVAAGVSVNGEFLDIKKQVFEKLEKILQKT
ncbi:MAG: hypothetical protein A2086_09755 [Spirochaetes bacterium GWD1_27_9]|nr:MAG: hypothetical protein A2Y34_15370 [Spirochaetes bacterium GWC1_27_15]OHD33480.1 MAG: hypothetical protein A2086_09755 [Spirochaetes bacterium GWD1_27_9]